MTKKRSKRDHDSNNDVEDFEMASLYDSGSGSGMTTTKKTKTQQKTPVVSFSTGREAFSRLMATRGRVYDMHNPKAIRGEFVEHHYEADPDWLTSIYIPAMEKIESKHQKNAYAQFRGELSHDAARSTLNRNCTKADHLEALMYEQCGEFEYLKHNADILTNTSRGLHTTTIPRDFTNPTKSTNMPQTIEAQEAYRSNGHLNNEELALGEFDSTNTNSQMYLPQPFFEIDTPNRRVPTTRIDTNDAIRTTGANVVKDTDQSMGFLKTAVNQIVSTRLQSAQANPLGLQYEPIMPRDNANRNRINNMTSGVLPKEQLLLMKARDEEKYKLKGVVGTSSYHAMTMNGKGAHFTPDEFPLPFNRHAHQGLLY
jgi:hypothetical protein